MGLLESIFARGEERSHPSSPDAWLLRGYSGYDTASGVAVDADAALSLSAYYCGVRILAESIAQLPLILYRRLDGGGKERATDHPLYRLLHDQPNREQTSFEFREMMQGHLVVRGNAYAQKVRDGAGRIRELIPLHPDRTHPRRLDDWLVYDWQPLEGRDRRFTADQVLHLPGLSFDGVSGCTPLSLMRESIGAAIAEQKYGARFFGNDASPGGALVYPKHMTPKMKQNLKASWEQKHGGANAHRVAILEDGLDWKQIGVNANDAQLIQARKFSVAEIARILNLPPHMLKDLDRATHSNIEHQGIEFVTTSLLPWIRRWEQRLAMAVLSEAERETYFFEFLVEGFMRGDSLTRAQALKIQRDGGALSADEWREIENRNPLPDGEGKTFLVPMNMTPTTTGAQDTTPPASRSEGEERRQEQRATGRARLQLRKSYHRLFVEAAGRVVRKETMAARRQAKKILGERSLQEWHDWMSEFYRDHEGFVRQTMGPVLMAYGESVFDVSAEEVGLQARNTAKLESFLVAYAAMLASSYVNSSKRQLADVIATAEPGGILDAITTRLGEWEERRAEKIAGRETIQVSEAVAREAYVDGGVQRLVWRASGACPICMEMDGRVAEITGTFAAPGEVIEGKGASPLKVDKVFRHPPLHRGCECIVVPG